MNIGVCFCTLDFCGFMNFTLGKNICGFFQVLQQFLLTTCEAELEYYHQKVNIRVVSSLESTLEHL